MRPLLVLFVIALASPAAAQAPQSPRPPGQSCEEQLRAAAVLIPRLERARQDWEHQSAHEIAGRDARIRLLEAELVKKQAELDKLKPKAEKAPSTPPAPSTPKAPDAP